MQNHVRLKTNIDIHDSKLDSNRSRVILSKSVAREIFAVKNSLGLETIHKASIRLAAKYHISSKAIRDIWKGRSWLNATFDLWGVEDRPARRIIGRPKGKKDSKPRVKWQESAGQVAYVNNYNARYEFSSGIFTSMESCGIVDGFRITKQFHAHTASHSGHSRSIEVQAPWPKGSIDDQTACLLPRFWSLMQAIGINPGIPDQTASTSGLRFPNDPPHSMFSSAGVQGSLLPLVANRLLSPHTTSVGISADHSFS
jgi:hypothetical protein